jgi:hypothetical protein
MCSVNPKHPLPPPPLTPATLGANVTIPTRPYRIQAEKLATNHVRGEKASQRRADLYPARLESPAGTKSDGPARLEAAQFKA